MSGQLSSVQFGSVQLSSVHFSSAQLSSFQLSSVQLRSVGSVHFTSLHFNSVQLSSGQFSSLQFSSLRFASVQLSGVTSAGESPTCFWSLRQAHASRWSSVRLEEIRRALGAGRVRSSALRKYPLFNVKSITPFIPHGGYLGQELAGPKGGKHPPEK